MALGWKLNLRYIRLKHTAANFLQRNFTELPNHLSVDFLLAFSMICVERGNAPHKTAYQKIIRYKIQSNKTEHFFIILFDWLESCM